MKNILIILFSICSVNIYSQVNKDYQLNLKFYGMNKNYSFDISKSRNKVLIIASKPKENINLNKNDSLRISVLIKENSPKAKKEFIEIIERNKEYLTDTLKVKPNDSLIILMDSFIKDWNEIREKLKNNQDNRIILDGYSVEISLKKDMGKTENIYVRTPTHISHEKINSFISTLLNFYNEESLYPILK